jgi:hypothetical protein
MPPPARCRAPLGSVGHLPAMAAGRLLGAAHRPEAEEEDSQKKCKTLLEMRTVMARTVTVAM